MLTEAPRLPVLEYTAADGELSAVAIKNREKIAERAREAKEKVTKLFEKVTAAVEQIESLSDLADYEASNPLVVTFSERAGKLSAGDAA